MRIALSTGCLYRNPLSDVFKIASTAGFDGIELLIDNYKCNLHFSEIQKLSDDYGVPILSIHSPFVVCDGWGGFWVRIRKSIVLAKSLSVPIVNFHPPRGMLFYHRLNIELKRHVEDYKNYVKDSNIILTIENLPCPIHLRKIPFVDHFLPLPTDNTCQVAEFAEDSDIQVTFDTTHVGTTGQNLIEIYDVFKDRIANVHLSDFDGEKQHLLLGKGYLPLRKFISRLQSDNYKGIITLETHPTAMEAGNIIKATQNAKQCLLYIKKVMNK